MAQPESVERSLPQVRPSVAFVAWTFTLSWLTWAIEFTPAREWHLPVTLIGTAMPSAIGLLFTFRAGGKRGLARVLRSAVQFDLRPVTWLYTLAPFPAIIAVASGALLLTGRAVPAPEFPLWFTPIAFVYVLVLLGPLGEEFGWRAYLLPQLLTRLGEFSAAVTVGIVWALWHLPLFFIDGTIQNELTSYGPAAAAGGYIIYTTCVSLLMTRLYICTGGNMMLVIVFHTMCNLSLGVAPIILDPVGAVVFLATLTVATAAVLLGNAKRHT